MRLKAGDGRGLLDPPESPRTDALRGVVGKLALMGQGMVELRGQMAALAMATIPLGRPRAQEQLLYELLAGSLAEFRRMGTTLVGGHTIEGPQLALGFTVLADQGTAAPLIKGNLQLGDRLVLTKPLGTGTLLAAHMQAECQAPWMDLLLRSMVLSNQPASTLVEPCEIRGLTDVTGFGLAGHLLEMLRPSGRAAELRLDDLPLLDGFVELTKAGIESTLAPAAHRAPSLAGAGVHHPVSGGVAVGTAHEGEGPEPTGSPGFAPGPGQQRCSPGTYSQPDPRSAWPQLCCQAPGAGGRFGRARRACLLYTSPSPRD